MTKIKLKDIKESKGTTDWEKLKKQSDREIRENALSSQDAKLLSDYELTQLYRAKSEQGS